MFNDFHNFVHVMVHGARHAEKDGNHKLAGVVYIVVGFFLTPWLIGIPIMLYGFYKLFS